MENPKWLVDVNAALAVGAQLVANHRAALEAAAVLAQFELLLQHLDNAVASGAVESSRRQNPPPQILRDDNDQDWDGPSFRYSPPV